MLSTLAAPIQVALRTIPFEILRGRGENFVELSLHILLFSTDPTPQPRHTYPKSCKFRKFWFFRSDFWFFRFFKHSDLSENSEKSELSENQIYWRIEKIGKSDRKKSESSEFAGFWIMVTPRIFFNGAPTPPHIFLLDPPTYFFSQAFILWNDFWSHKQYLGQQHIYMIHFYSFCRPLPTHFIFFHRCPYNTDTSVRRVWESTCLGTISTDLKLSFTIISGTLFITKIQS